MNIIFLDFDGVIVHKKYQPNYKGGVMQELDPSKVVDIANLAYLADAKIVIHSTWVHVHTKEEMLEILGKFGDVIIGNLHPDWQCNSVHDKNQAIKNWLKEHPETTKYVVIDDDRIGAHPQVYVKNGWTHGGIKNEHIIEAVRILDAGKEAGNNLQKAEVPENKA